MPPLCPDCGWVLVKVELVRHIIYHCMNERCPKKESRFEYPMYAIEGTKPYFKSQIVGWLNESTPTEIEVEPKCRGSNCGREVQCGACAYKSRNKDLIVEYTKDTWEKDLKEGLEEAEYEKEANRLRGESPWRMCPRCGKQMNYFKWMNEGFKCQYDDCGYVTPKKFRPDKYK